MKLQRRYDVAAPPARFWSLFFDPEFTRRLHTEALGSTSVEIEALAGDVGHGLTRTVRYGQVPDAPGPVRKLFGAEVVTTERGAFDPANGLWTFSLVPATLGDKTNISGTIELIEGEDGTACEQVFSLEARVRIFGAGPVVERFIEKQARESQDRVAAFINDELSGP